MTRNRYARTRFVVAVAAIIAGSCREAPTSFESVDQEKHDLGAPFRLTFNTGTDQMPAWSVSGDSIYYSTASFIGLPSRSNGVLLALSPEGGPARLLLPELQANVQLEEWLTSPAVSHDGHLIAFVQLYRLAPQPLCGVSCPVPYVSNGLPHIGFPELDSLQVRVLSMTTRTVVDEVTVRFSDRLLDLTRPSPGVPGTWVYEMKPYQARWAAERTSIFRPSWSPDGKRLVFSDGQQLVVWTLGQSVQPIPNTMDAMLPAWSPDGQTIAYTRAERGVIARTVCDCRGPTGQLSELQDRIVYRGSLEDGTMTLIGPDGSNKREVGRGDGPAWTPNGQLVFRRNLALYRSAADGSNASQIPGTEFGHIPSISPNGRFVAFARRLLEERGFDIWVAPLAGAQ